MAYVKVSAPTELYHLTKAENLNSILEDGMIRRFGDTECWFCESLDKMKAYMAQTVLCEGKPYYAVDGKLCRYPKFVPEDYVLLKLTPALKRDNWYRWDQELPPGSPMTLVKAAREFSALKVGYRGDLAFRNAEVIDVARFLTEGIVQSTPAPTNAELWDVLLERIEREQKEYTDPLYRMTQGQLIANAERIAANHVCYDQIHDVNLSREEMLFLLRQEKPLEFLGKAWQERQIVHSSKTFQSMIADLYHEAQQAEQAPQEPQML